MELESKSENLVFYQIFVIFLCFFPTTCVSWQFSLLLTFMPVKAHLNDLSNICNFFFSHYTNTVFESIKTKISIIEFRNCINSFNQLFNVHLSTLMNPNSRWSRFNVLWMVTGFIVTYGKFEYKVVYTSFRLFGKF